MILAHPTAQGGGRFATGGRNGKILFVDSLANDGAGTFRVSVRDPDPAIICFRTSGRINHVPLGSESTINWNAGNGNKTILGETSTNGITLSGLTNNLVGRSNYIIKHLRFRVGDEANKENANLFIVRCSDIMIDHCSFAWSVDEVFDIYLTNDWTVQYSIITEALHDSVHSKGPHGYGVIIGGKNGSFHHNILSHSYQRMPQFAGYHLATDLPADNDRIGVVDFRWNVIYNWVNRAGSAGTEGFWNVIRNSYIPGPQTKAFFRWGTNWGALGRAFHQPLNSEGFSSWGLFNFTENNMEGSPSSWDSDNWEGVFYSGDKELLKHKIDGVPAPHPLPVGFYNDKTITRTQAYDDVLVNAGARSYAVRDSVDLRTINNIINRNHTLVGSKTGFLGVIDSQTDAGGWESISAGTPLLNGPSPHFLPNWFTERYAMEDQDENGIEYDYTIAGGPDTRPERFIIFKGGAGVQLSQYEGSWEEGEDLIYNVYEVFGFIQTGEIDILEGNEPETEFTLTVTAGDNGTVNTSGGDFAPSTSVFLQAFPASGFRLLRWERLTGDTWTQISTATSFNFLMPSQNTQVRALFTPVAQGNKFFARKGNVVIPIPPEPPTVEVAGGWADLHPDGAVTGGNGGDVLYFNESSSVNGKLSFEALWETLALNPKTPLTLVWTGGDYVMETKNYFIGGMGVTATPTSRPENKTIMGSSGQTLEGGGGLYLSSWKNIILRNFRKTGDGLGGDNQIPHGGKGMTLRGSERIWIDHMEIDGEATTEGTQRIMDGSADQGNETDFVTYSNCYFRRSNKTSLISSSGTSFEDRGKLKITFRNCLWENNHQRQPLMRFGQVHMYNNVFRYDPVFTASPTQYPWSRIHQIGPEAQLYIQNNKYYGHRYFLYDVDAELAEPLSGVLSVGNWFDPNPTFSSFTNGAGVFYKGVGSLRPENVLFNPNTIVGYNFPVPLMTPDEAEVYVNQWAGAKYHLKNPIV